jgi:hypothetical protein
MICFVGDRQTPLGIERGEFMSQTTDAGKVTEDFKNLFTKNIQGNMNLFKRLSAITTEAAKECYSGSQRKLPSLGESAMRLAELNLFYWSTAAEHTLAFANGFASAYEKALNLKIPDGESKSAQPSRRPKANRSK